MTTTVGKIYNAEPFNTAENHMAFICKLCILLLMIPNVSWAYIDPGSGSAIMSAIIGFFVAIGLVIKTFWYKIKSFFTGKKESDNSDSNQ